MRAFARSSWGPKTGTPTASIRSASSPTRWLTRSRSWIIRSITTPTSVERRVNGASRWTSRKAGAAPSRSRADRTGLKRSTRPTWSTAPPLPRGRDERLGVGSRAGDGLLDEAVHAALEQRLRDRAGDPRSARRPRRRRRARAAHRRAARAGRRSARRVARALRGPRRRGRRGGRPRSAGRGGSARGGGRTSRRRRRPRGARPGPFTGPSEPSPPPDPAARPPRRGRTGAARRCRGPPRTRARCGPWPRRTSPCRRGRSRRSRA